MLTTRHTFLNKLSSSNIDIQKYALQSTNDSIYRLMNNLKNGNNLNVERKLDNKNACIQYLNHNNGDNNDDNYNNHNNKLCLAFSFLSLTSFILFILYKKQVK